MTPQDTLTQHGWSIDGNVATKKWKFTNFVQSHAFVNAVAEFAEAQDHHPDIRYGWGYAHLQLTTHDAGGLTEKDAKLAAAIEGI